MASAPTWHCEASAPRRAVARTPSPQPYPKPCIAESPPGNRAAWPSVAAVPAGGVDTRAHGGAWCNAAPCGGNGRWRSQLPSEQRLAGWTPALQASAGVGVPGPARCHLPVGTPGPARCHSPGQRLPLGACGSPTPARYVGAHAGRSPTPPPRRGPVPSSPAGAMQGTAPEHWQRRPSDADVLRSTRRLPVPPGEPTVPQDCVPRRDLRQAEARSLSSESRRERSGADRLPVVVLRPPTPLHQAGLTSSAEEVSLQRGGYPKSPQMSQLQRCVSAGSVSIGKEPQLPHANRVGNSEPLAVGQSSAIFPAMGEHPSVQARGCGSSGLHARLSDRTAIQPSQPHHLHEEFLRSRVSQDDVRQWQEGVVRPASLCHRDSTPRRLADVGDARHGRDWAKTDPRKDAAAECAALSPVPSLRASSGRTKPMDIGKNSGDTRCASQPSALSPQPSRHSDNCMQSIHTNSMPSVARGLDSSSPSADVDSPSGFNMPMPHFLHMPTPPSSGASVALANPRLHGVAVSTPPRLQRCDKESPQPLPGLPPALSSKTPPQLSAHPGDGAQIWQGPASTPSLLNNRLDLPGRVPCQATDVNAAAVSQPFVEPTYTAQRSHDPSASASLPSLGSTHGSLRSQKPSTPPQRCRAEGSSQLSAPSSHRVEHLPSQVRAEVSRVQREVTHATVNMDDSIGSGTTLKPEERSTERQRPHSRVESVQHWSGSAPPSPPSMEAADSSSAPGSRSHHLSSPPLAAAVHGASAPPRRHGFGSEQGLPDDAAVSAPAMQKSERKPTHGAAHAPSRVQRRTDCPQTLGTGALLSGPSHGPSSATGRMETYSTNFLQAQCRLPPRQADHSARTSDEQPSANDLPLPLQLQAPSRTIAPQTTGEAHGQATDLTSGKVVFGSGAVDKGNPSHGHFADDVCGRDKLSSCQAVSSCPSPKRDCPETRMLGIRPLAIEEPVRTQLSAPLPLLSTQAPGTALAATHQASPHAAAAEVSTPPPSKAPGSSPSPFARSFPDTPQLSVANGAAGPSAPSEDFSLCSRGHAELLAALDSSGDLTAMSMPSSLPSPIRRAVDSGRRECPPREPPRSGDEDTFRGRESVFQTEKPVLRGGHESDTSKCEARQLDAPSDWSRNPGQEALRKSATGTDGDCLEGPRPKVPLKDGTPATSHHDGIRWPARNNSAMCDSLVSAGFDWTPPRDRDCSDTFCRRSSLEFSSAADEAGGTPVLARSGRRREAEEEERDDGAHFNKSSKTLPADARGTTAACTSCEEGATQEQPNLRVLPTPAKLEFESALAQENVAIPDANVVAADPGPLAGKGGTVAERCAQAFNIRALASAARREDSSDSCTQNGSSTVSAPTAGHSSLTLAPRSASPCSDSSSDSPRPLEALRQRASALSKRLLEREKQCHALKRALVGYGLVPGASGPGPAGAGKAAQAERKPLASKENLPMPLLTAA